MPYPMSTLWVTPALHWWIAPNDTQHNGWLCIPGSCIHCRWNLSWTFTWSCFDARCWNMNLIDSVYISVLIQEYTHKVSQNRIALRAVLKRNASSGEAWHLIPRRSGWIPTFKRWSVIISGDTQLILGVPGVNTTVPGFRTQNIDVDASAFNHVFMWNLSWWDRIRVPWFNGSRFENVLAGGILFIHVCQVFRGGRAKPRSHKSATISGWSARCVAQYEQGSKDVM